MKNQLAGRILRLLNRQNLLYLLIFSIAFLIYWATGEGHATYYNYYVRLADAFLNGRLYLLDNPLWLNELIPFSGGYYVVYPPLPAVIMTPLVALFGVDLNQTLVSVFFGSLTVVLAYFISRDIQKSEFKEEKQNSSKHLWAASLFGFSTIFWWLTSVGSVWLIAQVIATFFMFLAIHEAFNKNRVLLIGLFVGASFWCRLPTILGIFFFAGLIISRQVDKNWIVKLRLALPSLVRLAVGASVFVLLNFAYNYVRFGTFFDEGYWLIPGILDEPWFSKGLFNLSYIFDNLEPFLCGLPRISFDSFSVVFPMTGLAIWFTSPAFVFALKSRIRDSVTIWSWVAIILIALVIFTKGLSGWGFGYRYAVDFYPFLFLLALKGFGSQLRWYHKVLIVIGVVVNLVGTVGVNRFSMLG